MDYRTIRMGYQAQSLSDYQTIELTDYENGLSSLRTIGVTG